MNHKFFLVAAFISLSVNVVFSQFYNCRYLIPYRENNRWGFADTLGNIRVKPDYDKVNFFRLIGNGYYAAVTKDNKHSFINDTGKLVLPFSDSLVTLADEYYYARENNKYGVYHIRHKLLVPFVYDTFMTVKDYPQYRREYYGVIGRKDNKYYIVNYVHNTAQEITRPEPVSKTTTIPLQEEPNATVAIIAHPVSSEVSISADQLFPKNRVSVSKQEGKTGVVNEKSEMIVPYTYDSIIIINTHLFITLKDRKYGAVILNSAYKAIPNKYEKLEYESALPVTNNWSFLLFRVVKNNKKGFVGENGTEYFTN